MIAPVRLDLRCLISAMAPAVLPYHPSPQALKAVSVQPRISTLSPTSLCERELANKFVRVFRGYAG